MAPFLSKEYTRSISVPSISLMGSVSVPFESWRFPGLVSLFLETEKTEKAEKKTPGPSGCGQAKEAFWDAKTLMRIMFVLFFHVGFCWLWGVY